MENRRTSNGWQTFIEHWGIALTAVIAVVGSQLLMFFTHLSGAPWIWCYSIAVLVGGVGVALLFYAKLPLYRQSRFFTFGAQALPEQRRPFYRWGYRCAVFSIVLLACLLFSGR
jgi:hypothetical protein